MKLFMHVLPCIFGLIELSPVFADTANSVAPGLCAAFYHDNKIDPLPVEYFTRERAIKATATLSRILKGTLKDPKGHAWDKAEVTLRAWRKRERLVQEIAKPASSTQGQRVRILTEDFCMFVDDEAYDFDWPDDKH